MQSQTSAEFGHISRSKKKRDPFSLASTSASTGAGGASPIQVIPSWQQSAHARESPFQQQSYMTSANLNTAAGSAVGSQSDTQQTRPSGLQFGELREVVTTFVGFSRTNAGSATGTMSTTQETGLSASGSTRHDQRRPSRFGSTFAIVANMA